MVEFSMRAGLLLEMLKLTQLTGKNYKGENKPFMDDCILEVRDMDIMICAADVNDAIMCAINSPIRKENVQNAGKIPVELQNIMDYIRRFGKDDIINIRYADGKIRLRRAKPELEYVIPTIALESITTALEVKDIPFKYDIKSDVWRAKEVVLDSIIKIDASEFKEVIADGEQIQYRNFPITISKDKVICIVEDEESGKRAKRELQAKEIKIVGNNVASIYSHGFGNLFTNLSGEIKIWLGNEHPMAILYHTEFITANYLLASSSLTDMIDAEDTSVNVADNTDINEEINDALEMAETINEDDVVVIEDDTTTEEIEEETQKIPKKTTKKIDGGKNNANKK